MTVLENLMAGCHKATHAGVLRAMLRTPASRRELAAMHDAALACAGKFGLERLLQHRAGTLPAGQRRIVELARACIGNPGLLLLDEPSSGLNSEEIACGAPPMGPGRHVLHYPLPGPRRRAAAPAGKP
ncbi:ABC transport system permease protein HAAT family (plasmid) [Cupriavidus necator N-1]|uniref:ABC transport system permease protein HAAT family n=2 Tax=Cupriavidus necator TaxID=106590 RepID=F8GYD2_CUPNN|nr:ABC transport system permease protein HAAT family [Cupriavidus necator N-1]